MGAKIQVQVTGLCLPVRKCSLVTLCLLDSWSQKTVDHTRLAFAKIIDDGEATLPVNSAGCVDPVATTTCVPCRNVWPSRSGARTIKGCRYTLEIDLDQFLDDPDTDEPYEPTANDICEISPYSCKDKALLAAQLLTNLDCTLVRNSETGSVGIPTTLEYSFEATPEVNAANAAEEYLGFNDAGCSVRVRTASASSNVTEASTSLGTFAPSTYKQLDFNGYLFDTLNPDLNLSDPTIINPGADCYIEFPIKGVYEVFAQVQFAETNWGGEDTDVRAQVRLYTEINGGTKQILAVNTVGGLSATDNLESPVVGSSRKFVVEAGDRMRVYAMHTDALYGSVHGIVVNQTLCRLDVTKVH